MMVYKRPILDIGRDVFVSAEECSKDLGKIEEYDARYFLNLSDEAELALKVGELCGLEKTAAGVFSNQAKEAILCSALAEPMQIQDINQLMTEIKQVHPTDYSLTAQTLYTAYDMTFCAEDRQQVVGQLQQITKDLFADISSRAKNQIMKLLQRAKS